MKEYPEWLRKAASKGGKKSRRKLTKKEARRIAKLRWAAGVDFPPSNPSTAEKGHNARIRDDAPPTP